MYGICLQGVEMCSVHIEDILVQVCEKTVPNQDVRNREIFHINQNSILSPSATPKAKVKPKCYILTDDHTVMEPVPCRHGQSTH